jgi:YcxB-like protein
MTFDFQLTEDDFVDAQRFHLRTYVLTKWKGRLLVFVFVLAIAGTIGAVAYALIDGDMQLMRQLSPFLLLVLLWLFLTVRVYWSGAIFRKKFRKFRALNDLQQVTLTESEILYTSVKGQSRIVWQGLEAAHESNGNFLFYTQPGLFYPLPKRVMQPEQIIACRELMLRVASHRR